MSSKPLVVSLILTGLLTAVYTNHFDNGFYFDDIHTIVKNQAVRQIDLYAYFTDISTFGTMPGNRGYRPVVTLLNAIDYQLAGKELNPTVFHYSIFLSYLLLGGLLCVFFKNLLNKTQPATGNATLLITTAYMFHTANAETVNYIIARSDLFSTLCVVATLVLFQFQFTRRWQLYLVPLIVGLFTKEVTLMAVPLLWLYDLLFERQFVLGQLASSEGWKRILHSVFAALPAAIVGFALLAFNLFYMTNPSRLHGGLAHPRMDYFTTQFVVVAHYIGNFFLPVNLSADPDFKVTAGLDPIKLACLALLVSFLLIALACLTRPRLSPIGFGILWFFGTLVPTSTINPLHQVANDHRTFLPYIGLTLACGWALFLLYEKLSSRNWVPPLTALFLLFYLVGHSYGIYQRNEVWGSAESLWSDTVKKSPNNGRAHMNYGLALMAQGRYDETRPHFEKTLELNPTWSYAHVNMAILQSCFGNHVEAEQYYKKGLALNPNDPESYYFYAKWLLDQGRTERAREALAEGHRVSPGHTKIRAALDDLDPSKRIAKLEASLKQNPNADDYLDLSLAYYQNGDYERCIEACHAALELDPAREVAHNNLCSAYIKLERWDEAIEHGEKAVSLNPNFQRAANNLAAARRRGL